MRQTAAAVEKATGCEVVYVLKGIELQTGDFARGVYTGDRIIIQCDHNKLSVKKIGAHEAFHAFAARDRGLVSRLRERILEAGGGKALDETLGIYIQKLAKSVGLRENMDADSYEAAMNKIVEEIFADAYAGINAYGAEAAQFRTPARETVDRSRGKENAAATARKTGPPGESRLKLPKVETVKFSAEEETEKPAPRIFKNGISSDDLDTVHSLPQKSINDLTSEETQSLAAFAEMYWKDIRELSPFFRAWFGDWRANDHLTKVKVADKKGITRTLHRNADTGWDINISGMVYNETKSQQSSKSKAAVPYLDYLDDIVEKAVLLDSWALGAKQKSENSILMHSFYAVADIGNGPELLKLYVEEMNDPNQEKTAKRTYKLLNIEKPFPASGRVQGQARSSVTNTGNDIRTIADLFEAVKASDKDFNPRPSSLVVDENGRPKIMYRGDADEVRVFDRKKSRGSNLYGRGFYFTDSKEHAGTYGQARPYYLSIKEPLSPGQKAITREQMRAFLEAVAVNEDDFSFENYGQGATIERVLRDIYGKGDFDMLQDVSATAIGDLAAAVELFNEVNGTRYDGIVLPTETVIFRSEQAKSATENIGTYDRNNPDTHFSIDEDTVEDYMAAVEAGDMETAQRMADEAAKAAGYTIRAYHGTGSKFTVFDKSKIGSTYSADSEGFFFSSEKEVAEYAASDAAYQSGEEERVLESYLRMDDPLELTAKEDPANYYDKNQSGILQMMHDMDHDGIIIHGKDADMYVVLDSEQVKSADPVTYDDNGNVIPLSERFHAEKEDIRWSVDEDIPQSSAEYARQKRRQREEDKTRRALDKETKAKLKELDAEIARRSDESRQRKIFEEQGADALAKEVAAVKRLRSQAEKLRNPQEKKPVAKSKAIIAKSDLKKTLVNLFSVPAGSRGETGQMIEATAEKLIREGRISEDDRQALFDKLYGEGVMTVAADDMYQAARALVNGG